MSIQFAMMGMMVAGAVMQGVSKANADKQAARGQMNEAAMNELRASEARLNAAQQEQSMWGKALQLLSTNEAQLGVRGVTTDPGSSAAVIQQHNIDAANEQGRRIRFMGDMKAGALDFTASENRATADFYNSQAPIDMMSTILMGVGSAGSKFKFGGGSTTPSPSGMDTVSMAPV